MKRLRAVYGCWILCMLALTISLGGLQPLVADEPRPADVENRLKEIETKWAETVATNDADQIGKFFTEDFLFVGAGGILQDRKQHLEDFRNGTLKVESVKITDFKAHCYANFAVVNTQSHVVGKLGPRDITGDYRFMDTFSFTGKQWLAVARQQTKVAGPPPAAQRLPNRVRVRTAGLSNELNATRPGVPSVLLFVKGSTCPLCMSQIAEVGKALSERDADVTVISASTSNDLKNFPSSSFKLVSDSELKLFKEYGVFDGEAKHGTIVRDGSGKELLRRVGDEPFTETSVMLAALDGASPLVVSLLGQAPTEKEVTGTNPQQWKYLTESTSTRPATIGSPDGRMQVPVKNGDIVSFKVTSGLHSTLFENAQTELTAGVWEVVPASGTLQALPASGFQHYDHTVARTTVARTGNLIKIRIKNLAPGSAILFACNPHSETATGRNVSMLGAIVPEATEPGGGEIPPACQCQTASGITRIRKNIDCLTEQELRNLEHAFSILKQRSAMNAADKTGYDYQVRIHGDRRVGPCNHNSELIWPWHRAFLYYFEDLLRASDPDNAGTPTKDVTLAYWDWTKPPSGTVGYPRAFENPSSPLFYDPPEAFRKRNVWSAMNPPPLFTDIDVGLDISDWYLFGGTTSGPGQLEAGGRLGSFLAPHNDGHSRYVGGDMGNPAVSVRDPIFWAHHANLDRVWDLWQQQRGIDPAHNPVQQSATLPGWPATSVPPPVVSNFNDIRAQLNYDYCNPPATRVMDLQLAAVAKSLPQKGGPLSLKIDPKQLHRAAPVVRRSRAQIRLTGVKTPTDTTYLAKVFLHPENVAANVADPAFISKYQTSSFTLWAMGNDHQEEGNPAATPETLDLNLDVTEKYEQLVRSLPAGTTLTVTFDFAAVSGTETKPLQYGQQGVEFGEASLIVNPTAPPAKQHP